MATAIECDVLVAGSGAGGLAAAVPISSIPALFWLSLERGGTYATTAALGTRVTLGRTGRYALRAEIAWMRDDVLGVGATHRSIALGIAYRMR